jgi:hypothetical protein
MTMEIQQRRPGPVAVLHIADQSALPQPDGAMTTLSPGVFRLVPVSSSLPQLTGAAASPIRNESNEEMLRS